jgi:hypothetical protein
LRSFHCSALNCATRPCFDTRGSTETGSARSYASIIGVANDDDDDDDDVTDDVDDDEEVDDAAAAAAAT